MTGRATTWIGLGLCILAAACTERDGGSGRASKYVLEAAPKPAHPLDIQFGEHLRLLGYDLERPTWKAGDADVVVWYWKVEKAVPKGWKLFTHVAEAPGATTINADKLGSARRTFPVQDWPEGAFVRDEQMITVNEVWAGPEALFYMGLWKKTERMPVRGNVPVSDGRALVAKVPVSGSKAHEIPILHSVRAMEPIRLDGKLDELDWRVAVSTLPLVHTRSGEPAEPRVTVRTTWSDTHAFFAFEVADTRLMAPDTTHDAHLWKWDCVEIMLDPGKRGKNYFELQVSPRGVSFDTRYDSRRQPKPYGHLEWESGIEAAVDARGTVDDDGADEGYTVELRIPWTAFTVNGKAPALPSQGGGEVEWRANFYVMDTLAEGQRAVGWSPPLVGDFHVPDRFGKLIWASVQRASAAAPAAAPDRAPAE